MDYKPDAWAPKRGWEHYLDKAWTSRTSPVPLTDGYIEVSNAAGIGVALNEDALKERLDDGFKPF